MPIAAATDFISLARLRTQLNIGAGGDDDELTDILASGIRRLEDLVSFPVLDRRFRVLVCRPNDRYAPADFGFSDNRPFAIVYLTDRRDAPIRVPQRGVRGAMEVTYWTPTQERREAPSGSVTPGRVERGDYFAPQGAAEASVLVNNPTLYPPADGWPEALDGSPYVVTGNAGFAEVADVPPSWRMAALALCSAQFEGPEAAPKFTDAAKALLMQDIPLAPA